ncbi:hypothetical protein GCM10010912_50690 [Paenibacillus albidus]|uniref:Uncharacterized protein n=1 Tax=Paenibacillus albidus TaxID=2041023 RepID=A0A917FTB3_9BACL|nr:hypothetical protein GCM10010912_50690 [Paenibacillus albidus]
MYKPIHEIKNEMGMNRFIVFSKRLKREIRLYNDLQYDHRVLVETNLDIKNYCERPHKILILAAGEVIETIFDMWVNYGDKEEFVSSCPKSRTRTYIVTRLRAYIVYRGPPLTTLSILIAPDVKLNGLYVIRFDCCND